MRYVNRNPNIILFDFAELSVLAIGGAAVAGESCPVVAVRFGVAISSVVKWSLSYRATGSLGKMRGDTAVKPVA